MNKEQKIQAMNWPVEGEIISLWKTKRGFEVRSKTWGQPIEVIPDNDSSEAIRKASNMAHGLYFENLGLMYQRRAGKAAQ